MLYCYSMIFSTTILELTAFLVFLILLAAFFAASETGLMALNRYRLRNLANKGNRTAKLTQKLLGRPDRLLGVIVIGNTFTTILASSVATVVAVRLWGEGGVVISTITLTLIILIFAEITPKTLAVLYSQKISFFVAWPLWLFLWILYPIVWFGNVISNNFLRLFGVKINKKRISDQLNIEELRTVVNEAGGMIPIEDQEMLLSILELGRVTVEDIMIPRNEVIGVDLDDDWDDILEQLLSCQQSFLPVYHASIDKVLGVLSLRACLSSLINEELTKSHLKNILLQPYFVTETTSLGNQLLNFRKEKRHIALVVDEYGEIQGMISLEDILEEIVGEFIVDVDTVTKDLHLQPDGSYIVDGTITLRELNKLTSWNFSLKGPKTLSGLIIEHLQEIPHPKTSVKIAGYSIEIISVKDNIVKAAKIFPKNEGKRKVRNSH
jgi:Mg2+/Co2+ transporter CorB